MLDVRAIGRYTATSANATSPSDLGTPNASLRDEDSLSAAVSSLSILQISGDSILGPSSGAASTQAVSRSW